MPKYGVTVLSWLRSTYYVEADNSDDAYDKAFKLYDVDHDRMGLEFQDAEAWEEEGVD